MNKIRLTSCLSFKDALICTRVSILISYFEIIYTYRVQEASFTPLENLYCMEAQFSIEISAEISWGAYNNNNNKKQEYSQHSPLLSLSLQAEG